ncbi:hypothetical protein LCGC14_1751930 [marine sediment metagenome]|uniref:Ankyrin repeat domain-containing protein n=1 Tax=marine sediment metagenome TaxID=412755 RepID=A0A0F9HQY9_9ZZZZ
MRCRTTCSITWPDSWCTRGTLPRSRAPRTDSTAWPSAPSIRPRSCCARADRRAEPTARNHYALRAAAEFGHAVVVDLLLHDGRADPAAINMGTITHTNLNGHGNILRLILKHPTLANRVAIARSTWCQRSARARACVLRGPELDFGAFVDAADSPIARGDQVGRLFVNRSFFFLGLLLQQTSIDAYGRRRN